ncbi:hypothetical protein NDU88_003908 [Pleurodeles waltl]|uniref:Uncharacterized protein n=1 Tax=Pleurodeles waltl TaxID=8319 RepID=A0AAV7SH92_PLEWA|nr:hypothetical protein NDU88_003908 [Pleurodeles waltl]
MPDHADLWLSPSTSIGLDRPKGAWKDPGSVEDTEGNSEAVWVLSRMAKGPKAPVIRMLLPPSLILAHHRLLILQSASNQP